MISLEPLSSRGEHSQWWPRMACSAAIGAKPFYAPLAAQHVMDN